MSTLLRRTPALPVLAVALLGAPVLVHAQDTPPAPAAPQAGRGGADPSDDAFRMGSPPALPEGMSEEEMWPAADAEGWRAPCLVHWQRTFDDALRVARAENRPILVAVNMDGEIASEHFAGVRYRQQETADWMSRYVCVVASVYRHTPRDYDEHGRRVECPRFGTVTCGEHIQAERELYEKYFDGKRIAPRHIVLGLDGEETYDVYYSWDTETVFTTFRKGLEGWPEPSEPPERTLLDRLASADVEDRELVERAYLEGDFEVRRAILERLITEHRVDQVEVVRGAIFGFDLELAQLGRHALAQCDTEGALDLMAEVLKTPLEASERDLLLEAVARMARSSFRARTLQSLHGGLALGSANIDPQVVARPELEYEANAKGRLDVQARAEAARATPGDAGAQLALAESLLARAEEAPDARFAVLLLEDARAAAREAERRGLRGPRVDAALAVAAAGLRDWEEARARAIAAVEGGLLKEDGALASDPGGGLDRASTARVLRLFAEARQRAIRDAYHRGETWPPEWLSDVTAAYTALIEGGLADEEPLVRYYDFLLWLGATPRANAVLDDALLRFPDSPVLHDRLRGRLLWEDGPEGLERAYAERLAAQGDEDTQLTWFAGYASLVAAEHHRRRGEFEAALRSYEQAVAYYERNVELAPEGRDTCLHYTALALAGRARVQLERGELAAATEALIAALTLRPDSAASPDGLNLTPVQTARMLAARLDEAGDGERAARVRGALEALDPRLLEPPPTELPRARRGGRRDQGPQGAGR